MNHEPQNAIIVSATKPVTPWKASPLAATPGDVNGGPINGAAVRRAKRWRWIAGLLFLAALGREVSTWIERPGEPKSALVKVQAAPPESAAEARRREGRTAARARQRYAAEVRRMQQAQQPAPVPEVTQPETRRRRPVRQTVQREQRGVGLGEVLRTAGQIARTAERVERGRFNLSHELTRAGRAVERYERR